MPLRFSDSTGRPESAALSLDTESAALALDIPPRAQRLLTAGELSRYRELFAQTAAVDDPHRRYWLDCQLIERGLAAAAITPPGRLCDLFATIATGALDILEREPREPKLLNYAGVALYELWSLDAARALFKAARRLDPRLAQVDRNLAEVARRRRSTRGARRARPLHGAMPDLERRALQIAARARPASGLRLSLCMIVRDEQEMLPRCLAAVADAVDEIVIVDTGSVDATIEIARSFGARVIEREWTGSFAEARNVSFDAAAGDWVMYLDADEVLVREDAGLLRSLTGRTWREAFYLAETSYTGELDAGTAVTHNALRVFRNRPSYRFEGRLHEQIAGRLPVFLSERLEATSIRVEHYGYLGAVRDAREKSRRNIELLQAQRAECPATPFLHYNLGSEYAAAGDSAAALGEFERAWELLEGDPERDSYQFSPALVNRLAGALRACGRTQDAIALAEQGLARFPGFTDLVLEQAHALLALGQTERAIECYERCIEMGDAPRDYTATVGAGTHLPRIALGEVLLAQRRYADAAAVAGELPPEGPLARLACRIELRARIAGADAARAPDALRRAAGAGMDAQELDLFTAWSELAFDGHTDISLSIGVVPLLAVILERLLRAQDFKAFELLLGLLARTPFAERERRRLLAEMYMRRGFLASAAQEWIAICSERPDADALLGLGRVAEARGMRSEAIDFAAAALEREPDNRAAADLLVQVEGSALDHRRD